MNNNINIRLAFKNIIKKLNPVIGTIFFAVMLTVVLSSTSIAAEYTTSVVKIASQAQNFSSCQTEEVHFCIESTLNGTNMNTREDPIQGTKSAVAKTINGIVSVRFVNTVFDGQDAFGNGNRTWYQIEFDDGQTAWVYEEVIRNQLQANGIWVTIQVASMTVDYNQQPVNVPRSMVLNQPGRPIGYNADDLFDLPQFSTDTDVQAAMITRIQDLQDQVLAEVLEANKSINTENTSVYWLWNGLIGKGWREAIIVYSHDATNITGFYWGVDEADKLTNHPTIGAVDFVYISIPSDDRVTLGTRYDDDNENPYITLYVGGSNIGVFSPITQSFIPDAFAPEDITSDHIQMVLDGDVDTVIEEFALSSEAQSFGPETVFQLPEDFDIEQALSESGEALFYTHQTENGVARQQLLYAIVEQVRIVPVTVAGHDGNLIELTFWYHQNGENKQSVIRTIALWRSFIGSNDNEFQTRETLSQFPGGVALSLDISAYIDDSWIPRVCTNIAEYWPVEWSVDEDFCKAWFEDPVSNSMTAPKDSSLFGKRTVISGFFVLGE